MMMKLLSISTLVLAFGLTGYSQDAPAGAAKAPAKVQAPPKAGKGAPHKIEKGQKVIKPAPKRHRGCGCEGAPQSPKKSSEKVCDDKGCR